MIAVSGDLLKMFHVKQTYGGSNEKMFHVKHFVLLMKFCFRFWVVVWSFILFHVKQLDTKEYH